MIWRFFPGPWWLRVFVMLAVLAAVVYTLIVFVYPYVATLLVTQETTVE
ncbi:hypothetical protein ACTNFJ_11400 [Leucobacter sp. W1153]